MKKLFAGLMAAAALLGVIMPVQAVPARIWADNTVFLLDQSAVPVTVTGTTADTTLMQVWIPGGMLGTDGAVRITGVMTFTGSANSKTLKAVLGGTAFWSRAETTNTIQVFQQTIRNRGSQSSQVGQVLAAASSYTSSVSSVATGSVNTAGDVLLELRCQLASAAETCTLEGYTVEVLRP